MQLAFELQRLHLALWRNIPIRKKRYFRKRKNSVFIGPNCLQMRRRIVVCRLKTIASIFICTLILSACLDREETITVNRDGSVKIKVYAEGDLGDLQTGFAVPSSPGWDVKKLPSYRKEDRTIHRLQAERLFALQEPLPNTYAPEGNHGFLEHCTTVKIFLRQSHKIYSFRRVYPPRSWRRYEIIKSQYVSEELLKRNSENGFESLSSEEQTKLLTGIISFVRAQRLRRAEDALGVLIVNGLLSLNQRELAMDVIQNALTSILKIEDFKRIFLAKNGIFKSTVKQMTTSIDEIPIRVVSEVLAGDTSEIAETALRREVDEFRNTEDLKDENFTIRVFLPGEIVDTNADFVSGGCAIWRFKGEKLFDCEKRLFATSVNEFKGNRH